MGDRTGSLNLDVHTAGSEVWVRDESEGWLKASVIKVGSTALVVKTEKGDERTVPVSECPLQNNDARGGVEVRFPALSSQIVFQETAVRVCSLLRRRAGLAYAWVSPLSNYASAL